MSDQPLRVGDDGEIQGLPPVDAENPKRKKRPPSRWRRCLGISLLIGAIAIPAAVIASLATAISTRALDLNQFGWYRQVCIAALGSDRLAFIGSDGTSSNVLMTSADGVRQCPVTYSQNLIMDQSVSPDGKHIAFTTKMGLYVIDANGQNERFLYSQPSANPPGIFRLGWLPDGTAIVLVQDFKRLMRISLDGASQVVLTTPSDQSITDYSYSPDSTTIIFSVNNQQLQIMDTDGKNVRAWRDGAHPLWSPDGQWLAFVKPLTKSYGLYAVDRNGEHEHFLADIDYGIGVGIVWSPDSKAVIFLNLAGRLGAYNQPLLDLDKVAVDGTAERRLIDNLMLGDYPVAWSPDGQWLAYEAADEQGNWQFYMADAEGKHIRTLSKGSAAQVTRLQWLPPRA